MYIGHGRLCVCVSVCLCVCPSPHSHRATLLHGPGCNLGNGKGCPLVTQLSGLQSVHGFRCYDNTQVCKLIALYTANAYSAEREVSASARTRPGFNEARDDGGRCGISWTICKSFAPRFRQITTPAPHQSIFTGQMLFLPPNQQRQSIEGKVSCCYDMD